MEEADGGGRGSELEVMGQEAGRNTQPCQFKPRVGPMPSGAVAVVTWQPPCGRCPSTTMAMATQRAQLVAGELI